MTITGRNAEELYQIRLLAWFYGMDYKAVRTKTWTQEEVDKAQSYCKETRADF